MRHWQVASKRDMVAGVLADRHYSRRTRGSDQFMPPGQTLVLVSKDLTAVFGWWRPDPWTGLQAMNGLDGWTCTIFRNEGDVLSSQLILEAEQALKAAGHGCGPDGLITYVYDQKVQSTNKGCCFKKAGYRVTGRSVDGRKTLLQKPWALAGVAGIKRVPFEALEAIF